MTLNHQNGEKIVLVSVGGDHTVGRCVDGLPGAGIGGTMVDTSGTGSFLPFTMTATPSPIAMYPSLILRASNAISVVPSWGPGPSSQTLIRRPSEYHVQHALEIEIVD